MRCFLLGLALVACTDSHRGRVVDAHDATDASPSETVAAEVVDDEPSEAVQRTAACFRTWIGKSGQGTLDFADDGQVPVVNVKGFDDDTLTPELDLAWYDQFMPQTVTIVRDGEHAGHVHLDATPPLDGSLGSARVPLDLRFDGTCAMLLGTARHEGRTGVVVIAGTLPRETQLALVDDVVFDRDATEGWAFGALDGDRLDLTVPEYSDTPIAMSWSAGRFGALSPIFLDDGDATSVTLRLAPDGRTAMLDNEQSRLAELRVAGTYEAITACLRDASYDGWMAFDGAPRAVHATLADALLISGDVTGALALGTFDRPSLAVDDSSYLAFGEQRIAVAADCSAAWIFPATGALRGAGFLFRSN